MAATTAFFWNPFGSSKPATPEPEKPKGDKAPAAPNMKYWFHGGVLVRPHDEKVYKGGEDAFAASKTLLVVADGVGGWADHGVDPGLFSKQLCKDIQAIYDTDNMKPLKEILCEAVKLNKNTGSSTCVLASLNPQTALLKTTNLGDSGYILFKVNEKDEVEQVFKSKEQQYRFNFPYQCGTDCDPPTKAFDTEHQMSPSDIIVMGSDGLFDNVFDKDFKPCIQKQIIRENGFAKMQSPQEAAECLGEFAYRKSKDRRYESPFSVGAKKAGLWHNSGKEDDITVIVA